MEGLQDIKDLLSMPKVISLIAHRNPDGDAIGSCLALAKYLDKFGHTTHVVMPSEHPSLFTYLEGVDDIIVYDLKRDLAKEKLENADIIFCLDFNALDRIDTLGPTIQFAKGKKIMIDHHLDPEPFTDYQLSDTKASSTCELVYKFIEMLDGKDKIDVAMGECILTGIITDTGSFKYATTPDVYRIASELKLIGVDDYKLQNFIFNSLTEKQLRLLGHAINNRMEIMKEYGVGIVVLNKKDFEDYQISRGDTEGIVNYLLMIKDVQVAVFFRQQPTIIKISFRSKGDVSVQELARDHFRGGGHKNASGGAAYGGLGKVINNFKEQVPKYFSKIEI